MKKGDLFFDKSSYAAFNDAGDRYVIDEVNDKYIVGKCKDYALFNQTRILSRKEFDQRVEFGYIIVKEI